MTSDLQEHGCFFAPEPREAEPFEKLHLARDHEQFLSYPLRRPGLYIYHPYRFVIPDRNSIFAEEVDKGIANLAVGVLRTQCERRRRTRYESDWAGAFGGSVSTC